MKILYFLFDLPRLIWESLTPFDPQTYRPSTEWERSVSEEVRNRVRLANYYTKRFISHE